jgi:hypothetical protein
MIEKSDITKMVQHVLRRSRGVSDPQIMHPMREWVTGIGITVAGVVCGAVLAGSLYVYYDDRSDELVEAPETLIQYKAAVVAEALETYRMKQARYDELVQAPANQVATSTNDTEDETDTVPIEAETLPADTTVIPPATIAPAVLPATRDEVPTDASNEDRVSDDVIAPDEADTVPGLAL